MMEVKKTEDTDNEKEKTLLMNGANDDDTKKKVNKKKEDNEGVPIDHGWAWVIALSVFAKSTITTGFSRCLSVLFLDISMEFDQPNTVTSMMFTVLSLSVSVSSVVITTTILPRYSVRTVGVVGAVASTVVTILISRAPNITIFLLLFVLKGITTSALVVAPIALIGFYFKKRRSLALSLATSGHCVAYIVFPPIAEFLRSEFGLRGCLLIISALELHTVAFCMLLRPISSYKKIYAKKKLQLLASKALDMVTEECKLLSNGKHTTDDTAIELVEVSKHDHGVLESERLIAEENLDNDIETKLKEVKELGHVVNGHDIKLTNGSTENGTKEDSAQHKNLDGKGSEKNKLITNEDGANLSHTAADDTSSNFRQTSRSDDASESTSKDNPLNHDKASLPVTTSSQFSSISESGSLIANSDHNNEPSGTVPSPVTSLLSLIGDADHPYIFPTLDDPEDDTDSTCNSIESKKKQSRCKRILKKVIDLSVFKFWRFRMYAIFILPAAFSNHLVTYMPAIGATSGLSKPEAALLMTVSGIMDLVSRAATGFLGDFKCVSISKVTVFSIVVSATICQCSRFFTTYNLFVAFAILVGAFSGIRQNFSNVMLLEYVGPENMAKAYSLIVLLATLSLSVNYPIIGAILDATGGFVAPLHYIGAMLYIAAFIMLWEPLFKRLDEKRKTTEEAKEVKKVEKV